MKVKKIPMRTCVVTREKYEKRELLRIVKDKDGNLSVDETGKMNGRGAYIKKDEEVEDEEVENILGESGHGKIVLIVFLVLIVIFVVIGILLYKHLYIILDFY